MPFRPVFRSLATVVLVVLHSILVPVVARAASYDVGQGQSYPDLQTLVDSGLLTSGDTVIFHDDDSSADSIRFSASNMAFTIGSADGTVKILTQSAVASHRGGFLYFTDSSFVNTIDFSLSNVTITGNTAQGTDTWISTGQGGAVATFSSLDIVGKNVTFSDNVAIAGLNTQTAGQGGAIWAYYILSLSGSDTVDFSNNRAIGTNQNNSGQGGAIYASTVDLSNARNLSFTGNQAMGGGGNPSVHTSGLGGAIAVAQYDMNMDGARNVVFANNAAIGGEVTAGQSAYNSGLGGAVFLNYSPIGVRSITGSTFLNNTATTGTTGDMSSGRGGAIFNSGSNLTLKAEVGGDIYFRGNTHNPGNTGAVPNSVYFGNIYTNSDVSTVFTVDAAAGAVVSMLDPMASQQDDLVGHESQVMHNVDLSVAKTGAGEWILGGYNDMRSATTWNVNQGSLRLEIVNGQTTTIDLSHATTAVFNLNAGTNLLVNPTDSAHFIYANDIAITGASGLWNGGAFSYGELPGGGQNAFLSLRAQDTLTNTMAILNPDGSFISGFFEYSYYGLEWRVNDPLSHDLVAWIRTRRYIPELGGTDSSTGPGAIAAQNVLGRSLGGQFARGFDCFDDCLRPDPCTGDGRKGRRVWASSLYEYTNYTGGGHSVRSPGVAVGMDSCFNGYFLGWSVLASRPEYRADTAKTDATTLEAALYGGLVLPGKVELAGYASIGRSWYDQTRYVRGDVYDKKYASNTWSLGADVGRRFHIDRAWMLRPFAAYRYVHMRVKGYRERSGPYGLDLSSHTEGLHFLRAGLETTWRSGDKKSSITGSVYYSGLYGDTQARVPAVFVQDQNRTRYTSYANKLDRHALGLGLSGLYSIRENLALTASYQFEAGRRGRSHFGGLGVQCGF